MLFRSDLQNEADEQEGSMELSHVIEEQKQQVDELVKEKEAARLRLEQVKQDIKCALEMRLMK